MRITRNLWLTGLCALALTSGVTSVSAAEQAESGYVVVLRDGTDPAAVATAHVARHGGTVGHVYRHALRGFAVTLTSKSADALRRDPRVRAVEADQTVHITDQSVPTGIGRTYAAGNANLKINGQEDYAVDVDIAVIDTGVDARHPDLTVVSQTDCVNKSSCTDGGGNDDHGHGSHVAGIAAAKDNGIGVVGIAPGARVWSVKVLDAGGSGQLSGVTAGVDWVAAHADEIEAANMSLGCDGCTDNALTQAISSAVGKGVVFAVAAGNNHKDARTFFPANHPDVVTVSALADFNGASGGGAASTCRADQDDTLADFSNFGAVVEIAAPGTCIYSTSKSGGYATLSGTSMAAPYVAGAAGLLTANGNRATNRDQALAVRQRLVDTGNTRWNDDSGDNITEPLLDVSSTADYPAGAPDPGRPTAAFSASCSSANTTCSFDASASADADGTITGYAWDYGDGSTGTGKTSSRTYSKAGFYSVRLTVTDNAGKTNVTRRMVKAGDLPPTASFTARCSNSTCTFDGRASSDAEGGVTYAWSFGDGGTATGATASHSYPAATNRYTVRLTVTDTRNQTSSVTKEVRCTKVVTSAICFVQI
ncbi:S8 family serine peptidase [Actinokineospora sp. HUAS TT18]|uniref:S8 family serine peptidase n=1 Tax=Actinokineospora sp. HUAS TT18 TaxID=3447451 RepID=UPI003F524ED5